jgi:hypothetical protein
VRKRAMGETNMLDSVWTSPDFVSLHNPSHHLQLSSFLDSQFHIPQTTPSSDSIPSNICAHSVGSERSGAERQRVREFIACQ